MKTEASAVRPVDSVLDLIGNTPMVCLSSHWTGRGCRVLAKLEGANPTGSLKDRVAKYMIERAGSSGRLSKDHVIVEASSGNTGISLAFVAALKGYRCRIYMPESKSKERRILIRAWGAELVLTDRADPYSHITQATRVGREEPDRYFFIDQNGNEDNSLAHYETTGEEILDQAGGEVHAFVAGLGTGGTLMGVGRRLKERWPRCRVYQVEPAQPISRIEGLLHMERDKYVPGIWREGITDETLYVADEDAIAAAQELSMREGLFVGISSGAVAFACRKLAQEMPGSTIVGLFGDRGDRYLTTALCDRFRD